MNWKCLNSQSQKKAKKLGDNSKHKPRVKETDVAVAQRHGHRN